jgi:hypothetical protein
LVNGDNFYVHFAIYTPLVGKLLCFSFCVVAPSIFATPRLLAPSRASDASYPAAVCATQLLLPQSRASDYPHSTGVSNLTCATARVPRLLQMAAAACAAPAGCRKERLLRWRHITFSQDERDNDLVRIIYARAEIGLINDSSSSATAILLYYIHCCPAIYCSAAVHESNLRLMVSFSRLLLS